LVFKATAFFKGHQLGSFSSDTYWGCVHGCGSVLLQSLTFTDCPTRSVTYAEHVFNGHPMLALFNIVSVECGHF